MRLCVTGSAGFIGSALVCYAVRGGHDVLTIDKLTYAGRREALDEVIASPRHHFLQGDIADSRTMGTALRDFAPDAVLHLAAESHIDRSIDEPGAFIATNVQGTFVLLEAALGYWSQRRNGAADSFRFVQISTDEVFGALLDPKEKLTRTSLADFSAGSSSAAPHMPRG